MLLLEGIHHLVHRDPITLKYHVGFSFSDSAVILICELGNLNNMSQNRDTAFAHFSHSSLSPKAIKFIQEMKVNKTLDARILVHDILYSNINNFLNGLFYLFVLNIKVKKTGFKWFSLQFAS